MGSIIFLDIRVIETASKKILMRPNSNPRSGNSERKPAVAPNPKMDVSTTEPHEAQPTPTSPRIVPVRLRPISRPRARRRLR